MSPPDNDTIPCWIYRSNRKDEMYLYLTQEDAFDELPEALMKRFGTPSLVMELALHPGRPLAREDIDKVLNSLDQQGYYLQMPPNLEPELHDGSDGL
ncbi:MAG: YcgL domain-containing protein [Sedimenticola sp.]